jgi:hypothetical protein
MGRSIPSEGTFARRVDPCVVAAEPGVRNDNLSRFPHVEGDGRRNRPRATSRPWVAVVTIPCFVAVHTSLANPRELMASDGTSPNRASLMPLSTPSETPSSLVGIGCVGGGR